MGFWMLCVSEPEHFTWLVQIVLEPLVNSPGTLFSQRRMTCLVWHWNDFVADPEKAGLWMTQSKWPWTKFNCSKDCSVTVMLRRVSAHITVLRSFVTYFSLPDVFILLCKLLLIFQNSTWKVSLSWIHPWFHWDLFFPPGSSHHSLLYIYMPSIQSEKYQ